MMLKDDERKKIAIIIASGNGGGEKMIQKDEMSDNKLAMISGAEEVLNAIKTEDPKMLVESLCALIDMHNAYREEMSEEEE